jgi:enoyl-CoA hydratase/carnithine racemase
VFGDVTAVTRDDFVATAEIGRPPYNYFDAGLIASLADAYEWLDTQTETRAIVLCAQGRHFCAGADFRAREGPGLDAGELYAQAARLFAARLPVVAAVQGAAIGGGLGLACSADFRVAAASTKFCANFARLGLHHGFALTVTLPAIIGQQQAAELLYTGREVRGKEAVGIGLADRLARPEDLRDAARLPASADRIRAVAMELASEIAGAAPLAIRSIRSTLRNGLTGQVSAAMAAELTEQDKLRRTADFAEGVKAWAERRPPHWSAR